MLHAVNVAHFSAVSRVFDVMSLLPDSFEMSQLPLFGVVEQVMAKTSTKGLSRSLLALIQGITQYEPVEV